jgi:hypothetical protein
MGKDRRLGFLLRLSFSIIRISLLDVSAVGDLFIAAAEYLAETGAEEAASSIVRVGSSVLSGDVSILEICQRNPEVLEAIREVIELKEICDDIDEIRQDNLQLYAVFSLIDVDDSKSISFEELWGFLQLYGCPPLCHDKVLVYNFFLALDTDGSSSISFKEFAVGLFARFKAISPFIVKAALTMNDIIGKANPELPDDVFMKNHRLLLLAHLKKNTYSYTSKGQYWNKVCYPIRFDPLKMAYCGRALVKGGNCGGVKQCFDCVGCTVARPRRAAAMQKRVGRPFPEYCSHPFYLAGNQYGDGFECNKCGVSYEPEKERWCCVFCNNDVCLNCEKNDDFTVPVMERCPKGHEMVVAKWHSDLGVGCDLCLTPIQNQIIAGALCESSPSPRWTCLSCDYDCCFQCLPY